MRVPCFEWLASYPDQPFIDEKVGPENFPSSISLRAGFVFSGVLYTKRDREDRETIPPGCYTCSLF